MTKRKKAVSKSKETGTDLGFISEMFPKKNTWSLERARKMVAMLKQGRKFPAIAKATGMSLSGCKFFMQELKKAGAAGYTLEQYIKAQRPCRPGQKVLAK